MTKRRRKGRAPPPPKKVFDAAAPPTLYELDTFSLADIQAWRRSSTLYGELYRELHFGLESQRHANRDALLQSLRSERNGPIDLAGWHRLVETRYCLEPLATVGSVMRYGGRFNIGREVGETPNV